MLWFSYRCFLDPSHSCEFAQTRLEKAGPLGTGMEDFSSKRLDLDVPEAEQNDSNLGENLLFNEPYFLRDLRSLHHK